MTTYHPPTPKVKQNPANVDSMSGPGAFDDEPPPEPRDGWLLVRIHVPELNVYKCLQFPSERLVWDVKQQVLSALPKELKESFNYGLFAPPSNGKAGKFLDEERRLGDYPFNGPVGYLELKYKRRVYKMLNLDERQLKALHTRANLRRFMECINGGQVEKIAKMCAKGLDPNFHCAESGETPLTVATGAKKPNKLLIALVNGGALLDYRTKDGTTALHRAVEKDSLEAVTTLLELGASPNYKDSRGITPLYISITRKCEPKISESLLHDHATLGIQDSQGWNEVHQACRNGLVQHLEHLLFYGADMDGHNASGNTPLHVCAVNNQEACARMLLFRGAHRGALNYANQTPYQVAVIAGNLELAEIIQNYKSDDVVPFRGAPRYNPKRRSGINWLNANGGGLLAGTHGRPHSLIANLTANSGCGSPSPCPSDHMPYSSASSSLSEGSSGHRSHEDDISIVTDKSLGDTSDIISDSSGVGTNSDSAACSIGHPSTTVVCMEAYAGQQVGHIRLQPGDVIEVVGSTDCGLLEGYVRGSNQSGFFPAECVQEVNLRQKTHPAPGSANQSPYQHGGGASLTSSLAMYKGSPQLSIGGGSNTSSMGIGSNGGTLPRPTLSHHQSPSFSVNSNGSTATLNRMDAKEPEPAGHSMGQYSSATAPRMKKTGFNQPRTVVLHRAKRGFGFILRGAKASSPLMQLKPSDRFPALQYLDDVDPGGVADMAGLKPGDFLLAIGGEDVRAASHEKVVEMIRSAGTLVSMTVISPQFAPLQATATPQYLAAGHQLSSGPSTPQASHRQCATLPRKMSLGPSHAAQHGNGAGGRLPAPTPPRRDPKTTLSVGRARAKSMVAGLENGGERADDDDAVPHPKSSSIESIATPAAAHLGTPVQLRTASIKARPTSSRITAAELEELFQRQQGEAAAADGSNRYSTMMTTSRFQSGTDSGAATPPAATGSPLKGPLVYGSVAEMKRKTKLKNGGTLRGKPCPIPSVASGKDLKRFHSTPDLHAANATGSAASIWANAAKGHHSQDDVATLHASLQRLNAPLPPPNHPPPPPPTVGQVVKVETRNSSEYESTLSLQQKLKKRAEKDVVTSAAIDGVQSSFNPSANAKIYASPQELRNVMAWKLRQQQEARSNSNLQQQQPPSQAQLPQQTSNCSLPPPPPPEQPMSAPYAKDKDSSQTSQYAQPTILINSKSQPPAAETPVYASANQNGANPPSSNAAPALGGPAPPIPEPDYSFSESDGEDENSILVARNTKLNEKIALIEAPEPSGNNNNSQSSGSSSGSASITHSLSVDEIQRVRNNLKTSKSSPDGFAKEEQPARGTTEEAAASPPEARPAPKSPPEGASNGASNGHHAEEEADNSSSGVSSDQEGKVAAAEAAASKQPPAPQNSTDTIKKKPSVTIVEQPRHLAEPSEEAPAPHHAHQSQQPHSSSTLQRTKTTVTISSEGMTSEAVSSGGATTVTVKQMVQQQYAPVIQQQQQQQMTASKAKALQQPQGHLATGRLHQVAPQAYMADQQQQHHVLQQQQLAHQQHLQQILKAKAAAANTAVIVAKQQQQLHKEKEAGGGGLELEQRSDDDGSLSPSPPAKAFQRHNSLTRKQAAAIAMQRATRSSAVSLVQLPPPLETDSDNEMASLPHAGGSGGAGVAASPLGVGGTAAAANALQNCGENIVLAPPPQFCDCNDAKHSLQFQQLQQHQVQQQQVHQQAQQQLSMQQHHHQQQQQQQQQRQLQQHLAMQQHQQQLQLQQHQLQLQQQQQHMQQQQQQYQLQLQGHHHGGGGQAGPGSSGTLGRVRLVPKNSMNRLH